MRLRPYRVKLRKLRTFGVKPLSQGEYNRLDGMINRIARVGGFEQYPPKLTGFQERAEKRL